MSRHIGRPSVARRITRFAWRCLRALLVGLGAALGSFAPPPPPPPPPPIEECDDDGQLHQQR